MDCQPIASVLYRIGLVTCASHHVFAALQRRTPQLATVLTFLLIGCLVRCLFMTHQSLNHPNRILGSNSQAPAAITAVANMMNHWRNQLCCWIMGLGATGRQARELLNNCQRKCPWQARELIIEFAWAARARVFKGHQKGCRSKRVAKETFDVKVEAR